LEEGYDLYLKNTSVIPQNTSGPAFNLLLREGEGACRILESFITNIINGLIQV
jgi:hypothetical protein